MNNPSDKTILIVNDSPDQRELLKTIFEQAGYLAATASDGREGFKIAKSAEFDLIVSDVIMPNGDGIELCLWIRADEKLHSLPILLVSGLRKDMSDVIEGLEGGADDYLELPVDPLHLIARAERLIERKRLEDLVRQNENHFRSLIENAPDIISVISPDGTILYQSPSLEQVLGFKPEQVIGESIFDLIHNDDKARVADFFEKNMKTTVSTPLIEYRFRNSSGVWMTFESVGKFINDPSKGSVAIINSRDITERRRTEQNLRESEENFRALVLATTQHVWTIKENDANEDIAKWWINLTGKGFEDDWLESIHPEDRDLAETVWRNEFADKILFDTSYRVRIKTGEYRHYAIRGVPVFNSDGSFRQWIGTFDDITGHKQIEQALLKSEEQLRQSQKLESVGRLAGGIAHDFNNMLTAINGYSELTLRKLEADNPLRRNIEEIKKAGERSALLTRQLLAFSRRQVLQPIVIDLNEVIADMTKMIERMIGEDVSIMTILAANLGHVTADHGQLTQVIMNLTVNSRDAMPNGGKLIIETANVFLDEEYAARHVPTKPGSYVMLAVTDAGSGMSDETLENIFEPFFTTKEFGKGTGLGLATVYGIVKQSGGFIWVDSEIGVGSTFKIYLPRIDEAPDSRHKEVVSEHTADAMATILVVEDEDLVRALTRRMLEEYGYKIIEASNGIQALAICRKPDCAIKLVITDVVMPQMGGRELAEKLAESCPQMPVLFTSGYTDDETIRVDVIEADTNFIKKPFTFESLTKKVQQFINKKYCD